MTFSQYQSLVISAQNAKQPSFTIWERDSKQMEEKESMNQNGGEKKELAALWSYKHTPCQTGGIHQAEPNNVQHLCV